MADEKSKCELCNKEGSRGEMVHLEEQNCYLCKSCIQLPDLKTSSDQKCCKCNQPASYPYDCDWKDSIGYFHYDCKTESKQTCFCCKEEGEIKEMKYFSNTRSYACIFCTESDDEHVQEKLIWEKERKVEKGKTFAFRHHSKHHNENPLSSKQRKEALGKRLSLIDKKTCKFIKSGKIIGVSSCFSHHISQGHLYRT